MVDRSLLKQLGWSEELINEVTSTSQAISSGVVEPLRVAGSAIDSTFLSSATISYSPDARMSGNQLIVTVEPAKD